MKVIVKYKIVDSCNLYYIMFTETGEMIPNKRIKDEIVPLGGIASNLGWLKQDVHRCTDEIKDLFPDCESVEYELIEIY